MKIMSNNIWNDKWITSNIIKLVIIIMLKRVVNVRNALKMSV